MNLILFPLRIENPLPVKLSPGVPVARGDAHLLLTGSGKTGIATLASFLDKTDVSSITEMGGAAGIQNAEPGTVFTPVHFISPAGRTLGAALRVSGIPPAAVTGSPTLYTGKKMDLIVNTTHLPVIYTMESISFYRFAQKRNIPFRSIRLVTDTGSGNIRRQFRSCMEKHRGELATILTNLINTR